MATPLPTSLEKSEMLYGDRITETRAGEIADAYAAAGRWPEAADFYDRAGDEAALLKLADHAVADGQLFLLARVERALGKTFEPARWLALAEAAVAAGRKAYAIEAYRRAGEEDKADELEGVHSES